MPQPSSPHAEVRNTQSDRQAYHKPRTSIGAAGHWVTTAGILAPLVIGEPVRNPEQRWRWIRISAVAAALISEGMWAHRI